MAAGIEQLAAAQAGQNNAGNAVTINFSVTLIKDDYVLAMGGWGNEDAGVPAPSTAGYSVLRTPFSMAEDNPIGGVWGKRMTGSPDTSISFTGSGNSIWEAAFMIYLLRGVDTSTALDVAVETTSSSNDPPSVTTITDGCLIIPMLVAATGQASAAPSGYGNLATVAQGGTWTIALSMANKIQTVHGAENPGAFTWSGLTRFAMTVALRPQQAPHVRKPKEPKGGSSKESRLINFDGLEIGRSGTSINKLEESHNFQKKDRLYVYSGPRVTKVA